MAEQARRGFMPSDRREFSPGSLRILHRAQQDLVFLLDRGYGTEHCLKFIGDHYQLSARQRMALFRATAGREDLGKRLMRQHRGLFVGQTFQIDGFNLIIPLEIALCGGTLLLCMDGVVRDLAGLHGTYRMISQTDEAIRMVGSALEKCGISSAEFYFDAPVSNAGRLAQRVENLLANAPFDVRSRTEPQVDRTLIGQNNVVSGDSVILGRCKGWINLARGVIQERFPDYPFVDLSFF